MQHQHYKKGITLVECIVGVTILAFAIAGPMTLASQSLRATRDARNELIATHLASEGIEVVHSIRDNNSADDTSSARDEWMNDILSRCNAGCIPDVTEHGGGKVWKNTALAQCPSGDCSLVGRIYQHKTSGIYRQSNGGFSSDWKLTPFVRSLVVTGVDDPSDPLRQVRVVVTVTYPSFSNKVRTITVGDDLYNWFPSLN